MAICQALTFCNISVSGNENLATVLKDGVINTLNAFNQAVNDEDMDKLNSYGRIYSELCLMLLEPIVNTPGENLGDLSALELILRASEYHDYSVSLLPPF
jgi:hypothetical protein